MCSPLVPRKGNQKNGTTCVRTFLFNKNPVQYGFVKTSSPTKCSDGSSMESRWSSKRVFPFRRNHRCRNSSTCKMWILRSKIFSRVDTLEPGQGQTAYRSCPLQSQRGNGQVSHHLRGPSYDQVCGQVPRFYIETLHGRTVKLYQDNTTVVGGRCAICPPSDHS